MLDKLIIDLLAVILAVVVLYWVVYFHLVKPMIEHYGDVLEKRRQYKLELSEIRRKDKDNG